MEVIRGGDTPKTILEQRVYNFKHLVDWSKANLPRYNPHQFELARNLDGLARWEFAKKAKLTTKRYSEIEKGEAAPTEKEVDGITAAQTHVIREFFEQWPETEIDISGVLAKTIAIDYYKYRVFCIINPRMKVI